MTERTKKDEFFNVISTEVCRYIATLEDDEDFEGWMEAIKVMRVGYKFKRGMDDD